MMVVIVLMKIARKADLELASSALQFGAPNNKGSRARIPSSFFRYSASYL